MRAGGVWLRIICIVAPNVVAGRRYNCGLPGRGWVIPMSNKAHDGLSDGPKWPVGLVEALFQLFCAGFCGKGGGLKAGAGRTKDH